MLSAFLLAILIVSGPAQQKMTEELPYHLLHLDRGTIVGLTSVGYAVSVDRLLDRQDIEKLVCQVLLKEKPPKASMLSVSIYYKLNEYLLTGGLPNLEANLRNHALADYIWNMSLPAMRHRLLVLRDIQGELLPSPQGYDFDHTKGCGDLSGAPVSPNR